MVNLSHDRCCGCGACAAVCPKQAIAMSEADGGAVYPAVDTSRCVDCGLCDKICPELNTPALSMPKAVYAAYSIDEADHKSCASGGAATIFGRSTIRKGGVVYGCAQINYRDIRHIRVDREEELELLKGSKYVQSDAAGVYASVKADLVAGRHVLFTGTPCQVGALRSYLQKPYENLCTVDLVCHGVPPQAMLRQAVEQDLAKSGEPLDGVFVKFRRKTSYGISFGISFGRNGEILRYVPDSQNAYMTAFLAGLSYRENCHRCSYARRERAGDITVGDFWELGKDAPSAIETRGGVSMVLVNTPRGEAVWAETRQRFTAETRTLDEAVKYNWNLHDPSPRRADKDCFIDTCRTRGIDEAARRCLWWYRLESTAVVRLVRRVPLLSRLYGKSIQILRKVVK